ncbi:protein kinase domain-containing protein [Nocardia brasiliensis]|uniref:protein kinase domain-containing protein n=1 Tax=Nocardia brasiliensis TaxID=37326 RepID=UPI0024588746|nr:protein kinase [Nocardia brasiliensis]
MAEIGFEGRDGAAWSFDDQMRIGDPSGFGAVFRGSGASGQPVAVKRIGADVGARRLREVAIGNIVTVATSEHLVKPLDIGMVGDDLLIVMPLADEALSKRLARGPVGIREGLQILKDVALGLQDLAESSLIHRDLKPGNILMLNGKWCIADFGMSRDMNKATAAASQTFKGGGTLPYMAPEIWRFEGESVKTDLYALGVVAYEVLTGSLPSNAGNDFAAWRRFHLSESAPELPPEIPPLVRRLVLRLLDKKAAQRPQDARYVVDTLSAALSRPLTPIEVELQEGAYNATLRAADRASAEAMREAGEVEAEERRVQAVADLNEIVECAVELTETLDGIEREHSETSWTVRWSGAYVRIELFSRAFDKTNHQGAMALRRSINPAAVNTVVLAGAVFDNVTEAQSEIFPAANIVCEIEPGRLVWKLWRFKHSGFNRVNYRTYDGSMKLGPLNRSHGMVEQAFRRELRYVMSPPTDNGKDPWTLDVEEFTSESLVRLLIAGMNGL